MKYILHGIIYYSSVIIMVGNIDSNILNHANNCQAESEANNRVALKPTSICNASVMQFNDVISCRDRTCVLKVTYTA